MSTLKTILQQTAEIFQVAQVDLVRHNRRGKLPMARNAFYHVSFMMDFKHKDIAKFIQRHRSTVTHQMQTCVNDSLYNRPYRIKVNRLMRQTKSLQLN